MSKRISALLNVLSISVLVTACSPSTPSAGGDQSSSAATMEGSSSSPLVMEPGADGQEDTNGASASLGVEVGTAMPVPGSTTPEMIATRVLSITTSNFQFSPNTITVKKGEKITLRLTGTEGNHGFAIADLGVNTPVSEGKTVDVDLPTDKAGTFSFRCSVPCGSGHNDMTGTITITE